MQAPQTAPTRDGRRPPTVRLLVTAADLSLVKNALNEVVNGLAIPDFSGRLGADWETARTLLGTVRSLRAAQASPDDPAGIVFATSADDRRLIGRALGVVLEAIDPAEFQTRLGVEQAEVRTLLAAFETTDERTSAAARSGATPSGPRAS